MRNLFLLLTCMISLVAFSQKKAKKPAVVVENKYTTELSAYLQTFPQFLTSYKLTSTQMRKMMEATFSYKKGDDDFTKALNKYYPGIYDGELTKMLEPYYQKEVTLEQLDSLTTYASNESIKRTKEGLEKCKKAEYREKKIDEVLTSQAEQTGKKKKKYNPKKFVSDCSEDCRTALSDYNRVSGGTQLSEDYINAVYHTVSLEDLRCYSAYLSSDAIAANNKAESAIKDDIFNLQSICVNKFQTWSYKAYPSLFTKKQEKPKRQKVKNGKKAATTTQQNDDVILDGGIYH